MLAALDEMDAPIRAVLPAPTYNFFASTDYRSRTCQGQGRVAQAEKNCVGHPVKETAGERTRAAASPKSDLPEKKR
jgi:hypothetical protein